MFIICIFKLTGIKSNGARNNTSKTEPQLKYLETHSIFNTSHLMWFDDYAKAGSSMYQPCTNIGVRAPWI